MVVIKIIYSNEEYEEGNDVILQYDTNNDYFDLEIVKQMQKQIEHMYPKSNIISIPQYIDINFVKRKRKRKELEEIYKGE